jgi:rhamnose utilization protein RhaD (predicted bifunctional aldolase and dehydrogenase)
MGSRGERFGELLALTGEVGDPGKDYVILAEGNTSARIDDGSFWVKGSGVRLEHARGPEAFVAIRLEPLMAALRGDQVGGADLKRLLADARVPGQEGDVAPSIETFVHAVCLAVGAARLVAHTHPTAVNALLCARDAEALYGGVVFPDEAVVCGPAALFVPYGEPGLPLGRLLLARFEAFVAERGGPPRLVLLANHGIVALGGTAAEVAAITAMAVKAARVRLGTLAAGGPRFLDPEQAERLAGREDELARLARLAAWPGGAPAQPDHPTGGPGGAASGPGGPARR